LSYSKIVLDEIQAYSPDLLAYIVIGLKKVKKVGGKFAILTATLPPFIKDCIEEEIGEIKYKTFLEGVDRHNLKVINSEISADIIYNHYSCTGGKVLVVCNTIKKAQELYKNLEFLGLASNEIELLHSKFLKKDRLEKEKNIINFGRTDILGKKIWISTSLVEASLDIDFDYLFTELNDLSGLFQRLGRVNRKGLKSIKDTNAFVFTQINKNLFINGKRGFIDKDIFSLSKEALNSIEGILSEEKKYELIEKYLTTENLKNSSFIENFRLNKNYMNNVWRGKFDKDEVAKEFRNIISYKCMPKCIYNDNSALIDELIQIIESESGEAKEKAKSELSMYTISLGLMDKNKDAQFKQIGKERIYFVNGSYSYELGFEKGKDEQIVYDIFL
ncbi:MAG: CRISPR-associated helicase Cas3', partial [Fusobacteriaceae bacterium]